MKRWQSHLEYLMKGSKAAASSRKEGTYRSLHKRSHVDMCSGPQVSRASPPRTSRRLHRTEWLPEHKGADGTENEKQRNYIPPKFNSQEVLRCLRRINRCRVFKTRVLPTLHVDPQNSGSWDTPFKRDTTATPKAEQSASAL